MKNTFLVGSFLPGYTMAFRYKRSVASREPSFDLEALAARFEGRAKRLRQAGAGYTLRIQLGLATTLLLLFLAFRIPFSPGNDFQIVAVAQELVTMEEIQQTTQRILPPPPPRPIVPIEVPDDEILDDDDLDLDAALELDEALVDIGPPPAPEEEEVFEQEVFMVVENMPKLIGGMANLLQAVEYPVIARKQGIEGNVIVKVVVDEQGIPGNPTVVRSASPLLDDAAIEAVMKQRFEPGKQRGRAVKVEVVMPVKFRLKK